MLESDLTIVGAGAKSAAVATKVHVLNSLGLGPISLTIVESTELAASWSGRNGLTSGRESLAVTPVKDVGYPYQSYRAFGEAGDEIDRMMMLFSWQQFLISTRRYARWIDAGLPAVQHREYGQYIAWLLDQANNGVDIVHGRVTEVSLDAGAGRWVVDVDVASGRAQYLCPALMLTGPGVHRPISHDEDVGGRLFHCDSRRVELSRIPTEESCEIAIVGGGESALSALSLLRAPRPKARFTVYTPSLPMSRAESFLENRVFSNPDDVDWGSQSIESRRDFVKHSDRGVFDPGTLSEIAYDERCRFVTGRVTHVGGASDGERVRVHFQSAAELLVDEHDYLVNCTGFDLLEQLRLLLAASAKDELDRRLGGLWERSASAEIPIGRNLELEGIFPRLHVPGLAGLSQGPGFANLGSLGILANRVLEPLVFGDQNAVRRHDAGSAVQEPTVPSVRAAAALTDESV